MEKSDFEGIFPPITTPFIDGRISYDRLASNVKKWSQTGIKGFVVLGSNGEYVYLSEEEKRKVVETVVEASPEGMTIIVGSGCESTGETLRLTTDCAALGAHAALVVTPHYYGEKMSPDAFLKHYTAVADKSPIPILLYNVPKFTHVSLNAEVVSLLSKHPNIAGIKDSSGSVTLLGELLNGADGDFSVLVGTAGPLFAALALGCPGAVLALANVAPENCVKIYNWVKEGDFEKAKTLQLKMITVDKAMTQTFGIAGLKSAMDMLGYFGGNPRPPLLPSTAEEKSRIKEILEQGALLP